MFITMIKKISHIIISLVLIISTAGITIQAHYCMNELKSVGFYTDAQSCCEDGMECSQCENHSFQIQKLKVDFIQTAFTFDHQIELDLFNTHFFHFLLNNLADRNSKEVLLALDLSPPACSRPQIEDLQSFLL